MRHRSAHPTLSYIGIRPQARTADGYRTGGGRRRQRFDTTSVVSEGPTAGWLEQAEEGVGRGALLLASATFLRKHLNHHRNREKVKFYDQMLTSCVKTHECEGDAAAAAAAAELQSWGC